MDVTFGDVSLSNTKRMLALSISIPKAETWWALSRFVNIYYKTSSYDFLYLKV